MSSAQSRDRRLQKLYGITARQYDYQLKLQKGGCALCGRKPKARRLHVDHDHKTERVRGLLCYYCNRRVVGRHRDADLLEKVVKYLRSTHDVRALVVPGRSSPGASPSSTTPTTALSEHSE